MIKEVISEADGKMKKSIRAKQNELSTIRAGRATPSLLDNIKVNYYGQMCPLKQVANVAAPDARLLVVQVFDKNAISEIDKAIKTAELGLNPQIDGNLLRLPIPQLSEERRQDLVKYSAKVGEEGRVSIRNIRRDSNDMIKELEKEHEISEDDAHRALSEIQKLTDTHIEEIDKLIKIKEDEILEI